MGRVGCVGRTGLCVSSVVVPSLLTQTLRSERIDRNPDRNLSPDQELSLIGYS